MRPTGDQQYLTDSIAGRYTNPQSNPFLNSYIQAAQRPTFDALDQTLSRTLPGRFAAAGQYTQPQSSSAFDRAAGLEATNAAHTAGDIASNIGAQAYNTDRNLQQQAVPLNQQEVQTTINNLNAQALPRLIQQYGIDQGLQMHNQNIQNLMGILQLFQGFTSPTVAQTARGSQETNSGVLAPIRIH
jgi:hypothetical protein